MLGPVEAGGFVQPEALLPEVVEPEKGSQEEDEDKRNKFLQVGYPL